MTTTPMIAFHGDAAIKSKYIARVRAHREADQLVQGTGWEAGRGCAVGCTLDAYDHSRYPVELGLPEWLARLEDYLFERLPLAEALLWPERFLAAIPVGSNVESVGHRLAIRRLERIVAIQRGHVSKYGSKMDAMLAEVIAAVEAIIALHRSEADGKMCDWSAARSAAWSAWSAMSAAEPAAMSAARSAAMSAAMSAAWSAAMSAMSARSAAMSAARSAARSAAMSAAMSAAWSAAESAAIKQESDDLIDLLLEAT